MEVAVGHAQKRGDGLLQIGGKARVDLGFDVNGAVLVMRAHADDIVALVDTWMPISNSLAVSASIWVGNAAVDGHVAVGGRGGDHQRAGFNLVGDHGIVGAVQGFAGPVMRMTSVPAPLTRAPMEFKKFARSTMWGSLAAL